MSKKLAINGGKRTVPEGFERPWPLITAEDKKAVMDVLDRGVLWGVSAPEVTALQEEWAKYVGTRHCLAVNSGTAALHIALAAAGISPGDEVITSAFSFLASSSCILHHNAIPVFVDIDPKTFNIDPKQIEEKISEKTKAIIPVHIHGLPADMDSINRIAKKYNLVVIEDACQAHGATYKGIKAGALGDMSAFSLNTTKNLAGGEGGLFNTNNEEYSDKAAMVRMFGEIPQKKGQKRDYNAYGMGWMYRSQEMPAAFTRSQLRRLDENNRLRCKNARYLTSHLKEIKGIISPSESEDSTHIYHIYRIRLNPKAMGIHMGAKEFRQKTQKALNAEGVNVMEWQFMPLPGQTLFQLKEGYGKGCPWSCTHARDIKYSVEDYPETVKLIDDSFIMRVPICPPNGLELMNHYVEAFRKVFDNIGEVIEL
ncbi:MAG: DegT/DnrJ/EryC1/StrS family aminotransferase [Spirochaetales bacterium]|nr:DegT/DnrJ/EryC1/StrS family aminotransferase [Spirochaetales bacterium]